MHAGNAGINLAVKPIEGTQSNWQLFNENLPEIGIGAVWIVLHNAQSEAIDLSKAKWSLEVGRQEYAPATASQMLKRYYKKRHIRMHTIKADETARRNLEGLALHLDRVGPSMDSSGFLFFQIEPTRAANWTRNGTLRLKSITLSQGRQITISLPLSYANP